MTEQAGRPVLSTVVLNWNRADLLQRSVESYLDTVGVSYELFIVDNASSDGSAGVIRAICDAHPRHHAIFLDENLGGEAMNLAAGRCEGQFIHFSENDMEYLPGWDTELLAKLDAFPEIGQLSPFGPAPQRDQGEIGMDRPTSRWSRGNKTIYLSLDNVSTTCLIRRGVWERGVRWQSHGSGSYRFPNDWQFSNHVRIAGYEVAFNDSYVIFNLGHNVKEMAGRLSYYLGNYGAKPGEGIEGFERRLNGQGYALVEKAGGEYAIQDGYTGAVRSHPSREVRMERAARASTALKRGVGRLDGMWRALDLPRRAPWGR